jgi:hypothetical protein
MRGLLMGLSILPLGKEPPGKKKKGKGEDVLVLN